MDERTEHEPMEQVLYEVKKVIVGQDQLLERLVDRAPRPGPRPGRGRPRPGEDAGDQDAGRRDRR